MACPMGGGAEVGCGMPYGRRSRGRQWHGLWEEEQRQTVACPMGGGAEVEWHALWEEEQR